MRKYDDVYVTNHKPIPKKYLTLSEEEDQEYFDYQKSIEEYNNSSDNLEILGKNKSDYERGS